jgi:hypothetical protein
MSEVKRVPNIPNKGVKKSAGPKPAKLPIRNQPSQKFNTTKRSARGR